VGALLAVTPFLLFPKPQLMWIAVAAPLSWVFYARACRRGAETPLNRPLLLLMMMVAVSLWATFDVNLSLGKVAGVLLGVFWFRAIVLLVRDQRRLIASLVVFCAGAVGVVFIGLAGTQWKGRVEWLNPVTSHFPVRLKSLPGAEEGFNPNAVGSTMLWVVPLLALLLWYWIRRRNSDSPRQAGGHMGSPLQFSGGGAGGLRFAVVLVCLLALALTAGMLLISQSRGAWVGFVAAALLLMITGSLWTRRAAYVVVAVSLAAVLALRPWKIWNASDQAAVGSGGVISIAGRAEIWSRAVYGIQDFPFTGMGMNAFRKVMPVLYPAFTIPPEVDVASAHNHILQAALDLGIPGMVAYLAIWAATARILYYVVRRSVDSFKRVVAQGIGAGLFAQFVFQLTDAIPLGAKVGIFFWLALGITAALFRLAREEVKANDEGVVRVWKISTGEVFAIWVLSSLLSIAFIGEHPYIGLALGIVGGIVLGYCAVENYLGKDENRGFTRMNADRVGVPESVG